MIRNFWVKNYLSISDKQELNFVTKSSASELAVEMPDGTCLYKLGVLYGSNASGKSNMLWALDEVFHLLTYPKANANMKISRMYSICSCQKMNQRKCLSLFMPMEYAMTTR